jgi:hypothetical protein
MDQLFSAPETLDYPIGSPIADALAYLEGARCGLGCATKAKEGIMEKDLTELSLKAIEIYATLQKEGYKNGEIRAIMAFLEDRYIYDLYETLKEKDA